MIKDGFVGVQMMEKSHCNTFGTRFSPTMISEEQFKELQEEVPKLFNAPGTEVSVVKNSQGDIFAFVRMPSQFSLRAMSAEARKFAGMLRRLNCVNIRPVISRLH